MKRILAILTALLAVFLMILPAFSLRVRADEDVQLLSDSGEEMPDWYPEDVEAFEDFYNDGASRVVDNAGILTAEEEARIAARIKQLTEKYNVDFVLFTDESSHGLSDEQYAVDFYRFNGYGLGVQHSGSILYLRVKDGHGGWRSMGTGRSELYVGDWQNVEDQDDQLEPYVRSGAYAEGILNYLENLDLIYQYGHIPEPPVEKNIPGGIAASGGIAGAIAALVAGIRNGSLKSQMQTIHTAKRADNYLVPGSLNMNFSRDVYLYSDIIRTAIPTQEEREGGGSSSHSSGVHSSGGGGGSFSGGGRDF